MTAFTWTDERIVQLTKLWADGGSCSQIGGAMGTSRNSIIGKANRIGLPERLRAPSKKARDYKQRPYARRYPKIRYRDPPADVECTAAKENPTALLDLTRTQCRWPVGEPDKPDFYFCGGEIAHGSYCEFHDKIAHQKPTPSGDKRPFIIRRAA